MRGNRFQSGRGWIEEQRPGARDSSYFELANENRRIRQGGYQLHPRQYCRHFHQNDRDKCYFMCNYCHSIHFKQDIHKTAPNTNQELCPCMMLQAKPHQKRKSLLCQDCGGTGTYEIITSHAYCEVEAHFQSRLQTYLQAGHQDQEKPERQIYRREETTKVEDCKACRGAGIIYRVIDCCLHGCNQCSHSKIKINPKWRQMRLLGQNNDEVFPCRICSQQVNINQKIMKLNCGHAFHRMCTLQWLANHQQKCYLCAQVDPYLQREDIVSHVGPTNQNRLSQYLDRRLLRKQGQPQTYNDRGNGSREIMSQVVDEDRRQLETLFQNISLAVANEVGAVDVLDRLEDSPPSVVANDDLSGSADWADSSKEESPSQDTSKSGQADSRIQEEIGPEEDQISESSSEMEQYCQIADWLNNL